MTSAVFDTSPLCYLVLIGEVSIARRLFEDVLIPPAVERELSHSGAPQTVRDWIADPPSWLQIREVNVRQSFPAAPKLDEGEREAIWLAQQLQADWLVLDEKFARRVAQELGHKVTGLIGLLAEASQRGLIDLAAAVRQLQETSFHIAPRILRDLLASSSRAPEIE